MARAYASEAEAEVDSVAEAGSEAGAEAESKGLEDLDVLLVLLVLE